jgi:cytochrome oxidase assembly protein ShyY1
VGFLLSRRWVLFAVTVVLLAWGAWALGQWQFHRLDQRKHDNRIVATNLNAAPVPVDDLLSTHRSPSEQDEWRRVTVHGTWDDKHTIVLKYQTRDGGAGVDVVTPLVTESGAAVLVDRGWMSTENSGASRPKLPPVSDGQVTVTGWVRRDATGGAARVSDLSTRAISSARIGAVVPYPLYGGFLDLAAESPAPAKALGAVELPDDTSNGPHFFYGLQWWFFGALAIFGFCFLVWDELRQRRVRRAKDSAGSERPQHAAVHGQHGAGDER